MHILINTDSHIEGRDALARHIKGVVERALRRFSSHVTRVEIHVSDQNGDKSGPRDKRCMMEARLRGSQPRIVTHAAETVHQAIDGAADRLERSIDSALERLHDHR